MSTFTGEPGKPDLTLNFEEFKGEPEPDIESPFEDIAGMEAAQSPITEGKYSRIMPHPLTGKPTKFPRASGFAISDETILTEWKIGMAVLGATHNRDLYALGNSMPLPEEEMEFRPKGWWKPWADLGHEAMDRMGARAGAHLGTAFHSWREQFEAGKIQMRDIPPEWREHMKAFLRMHNASALSYNPKYVERLIVNLKLHNGVCGRLDNLRDRTDGSLILDDTKTGKQAPAGLDEMGIQFAIYANAEYLWEPDHPDAVHGYIPMPANIYKKAASVSWVPINAPENSRIIPIDIEKGWEAAQAAAWLKGYWNRSKRKNNGLELPLSVLGDDRGPAQGTGKFSFAARISACATLEELSEVYLDMYAEDSPVSPSLEKLAHARRAAIRAEQHRVRP